MQVNLGNQDLTVLKRKAMTVINDEVFNARERYVPSLPGQEMVYAEKLQEAEEYLDMKFKNVDTQDVSNFPWVMAESQITGMSPMTCARNILNKAKSWKNATMTIETARRIAKLEIELATTPKQIYDAEAKAISIISGV